MRNEHFGNDDSILKINDTDSIIGNGQFCLYITSPKLDYSSQILNSLQESCELYLRNDGEESISKCAYTLNETNFESTNDKVEKIDYNFFEDDDKIGKENATNDQIASD